MIYSILVSYTCELSWILMFAEWIGYFVLGNVIFQFVQHNVHQITHKYLCGIGLICSAYTICIIYWLFYIQGKDTILIPGAFSAVVVVGSIAQFIGFSLLIDSIKAGKGIRLFSRYSFKIYLVHPLFCELYMQFYGRVAKMFPRGVFIPLYAILIIFLSVGLIWIAETCWHMFHRTINT